MAANILCVGYEDSKHDSREHEAGLRAPPLAKASLGTEIRRDGRVAPQNLERYTTVICSQSSQVDYHLSFEVAYPNRRDSLGLAFQIIKL
ncbi:hypothetical protein OUZ56_006578 [Daphnia magna]|uniref:Uncharacterized protein n=1 Tax=Daphnia magna TaxID=35525 RepID=A0ABQ9YW39_9CRUS|nr:hypothetical protein OUZ56_006578 [Daphnia magna]